MGATRIVRRSTSENRNGAESASNVPPGRQEVSPTPASRSVSLHSIADVLGKYLSPSPDRIRTGARILNRYSWVGRERRTTLSKW